MRLPAQRLHNTTLNVHVIGRNWYSLPSETTYRFRLSMQPAGDNISLPDLIANPRKAIENHLGPHSGDFQHPLDGWRARVAWTEPCTFEDGTEGMGTRYAEWQSTGYDDAQEAFMLLEEDED